MQICLACNFTNCNIQYLLHRTYPKCVKMIYCNMIMTRNDWVDVVLFAEAYQPFSLGTIFPTSKDSDVVRIKEILCKIFMIPMDMWDCVLENWLVFADIFFLGIWTYIPICLKYWKKILKYGNYQLACLSISNYCITCHKHLWLLTNFETSLQIVINHSCPNLI